jgi:hypothetical protein
MADVRRAPRDRGQLLLVGALALAVVFVALALLLNTAIYTGNLATRDSGVDSAPAIEYASEARAAGVDAVASVNRRNNTSAADLNRAFDATMGEWDDLASHHAAVSGHAADVEVAGTTNGTRIHQDDVSREFTSNTTAAGWTVVSGVDRIRSMRFTVDASELASGPSGAFHVNVTAGGVTRSLYVYDDGGDAEVRVVDDGTELSSRSFDPGADGTVVIDVSNGSVDGTSYAELRALIDVDNDADIEYRGADAAGGTYTMVVDEPPSALSLSGLNDNGPSPYWTDAVYGAELNVTYRTEKLDYAATVGVVPE